MRCGGGNYKIIKPLTVPTPVHNNNANLQTTPYMHDHLPEQPPGVQPSKHHNDGANGKQPAVCMSEILKPANKQLRKEPFNLYQKIRALCGKQAVEKNPPVQEAEKTIAPPQKTGCKMGAPLKAIMGRRPRVAVPQTQQPEVLKASASHLRSVNNILQPGKAGLAMAEPELCAFNLRQLIADIVKTHAAGARRNKNRVVTTVDAAVPAVFSGNALRLGQVLGNLLGNAVTFSANGLIIVAVRLLRRCDNSAWLYFSVSDTGMGIAPEHIERIYNPATPATETVQPSSVMPGLCMTRRLLQLMNSELYVESEPGKGSRFYFALRLHLRG